MPESKGRSKPAYTPPRTAQKDQGPNARWFVPVMLGLMVARPDLGRHLLHLRVHQYPVPALGRWNLAVGFGLMLSGFLMTTRWR